MTIPSQLHNLRSFVLLFALLAWGAGNRLSAQGAAVKTNLLYDASLTAGIGAEVPLGGRWSADLSGAGCFWTVEAGKRWKQWMVQPEARYWLCAPLGGHFFAAHAMAGQYNVGRVNLDFLSWLGNDFKQMRTMRHQGTYWGAGIGYGYSWIIRRHFNIEAEIAVGYARVKYDVYECAGCGKKVDTDRRKDYIGPTKAAINLVYVF